MPPLLSPLLDIGSATYSALLDAVFPPRCAGCDEWSRAIFCRFCIAKLKPVTVSLCECCGAPFDPLAFPAPLCAHCRSKRPYFLAARSAYHFEGPTREAVHRLKYREKTALSSRLAPLLATALQNDPVLCAFHPDFIVPVPLHPKRQKGRGYNQSFLLARELGRYLDVPVTHLLRKHLDTPPQVGLKRDDRARNIRDAFTIDDAALAKIQVQGSRFLLIDDVFTTGATLNEAAKTLKKARSGEVCALTLARS